VGVMQTPATQKADILVGFKVKQLGIQCDASYAQLFIPYNLE
jgi:hypothetical protein